MLQNRRGSHVKPARTFEPMARSDSVITIVGADEVGPGQSTANGSRLTWHFVADTVNDFAWATAKIFVWKATRATIPTKGPIPIHMLHLPGRAQLFARAGEISRHALEFYSKLWMPYQFPQLTLQEAPARGGRPMLITSNQARRHEGSHGAMVEAPTYPVLLDGLKDSIIIKVLSDSEPRKPAVSHAGPDLLPHKWRERAHLLAANYCGSDVGLPTYRNSAMLSSSAAVVDSAVKQRDDYAGRNSSTHRRGISRSS